MTPSPDHQGRSAGFTLLETLLVSIILVALAGTGWYVAEHRTSDTSDATTNTAAKQTTDTKPLVYTSPQKDYTITLPDGMVFAAPASDDTYQSLVSDAVVTQPSAPAKVVQQNGGKDSATGIFINYYAAGVAGAEDGLQGQAETGFKTTSDVTVRKYHYTQVTEPIGLGLDKGSQQYTYLVSDGSGTVSISYSFKSTVTPNLPPVEAMIKSVVLR